MLDIEHIEYENWSSSFSTEEIEDFQTAFSSWPLSVDEKIIEEEEKAEEIAEMQLDSPKKK